MATLLLILLSGYGLTMIVTKGYIFKSLREYVTLKSLKLGTLISCPQCFGIYCGFLLSLFWGSDFLISLYMGFAVSGICYTINKI